MNKEKKFMKPVLDIILGIFLCVFLILFIISCVKASDLRGNLGLKMATSSCFVLDAILWFAIKSKRQKRFPIILLAGIIWMFLGDLFIYYHFIIGAIAFAVGHIFYLVAYGILYPIKKRAILYASVLFLIAFIIVEFDPLLQFDPPYMSYLCLSYALIISCMTAVSISNHLALKTKLSFVLCLGSVLFYLSDIMVLFNAFAIDKWIYTHIGHILYFPGQFIVSQGIRWYFNENDTVLEQNPVIIMTVEENKLGA